MRKFLNRSSKVVSSPPPKKKLIQDVYAISIIVLNILYLLRVPTKF